MSKKLVIGCGYIGHRVARQWLANGDSVTALTRSASRANEFQREGITPLVGDVVEPSEVLKSVGEVSTLLYAVGFDRSASHSKHEIYVNGLKRVLDAIGDRVERFVYVSSISVYGQTDGEWVDEQSPTAPTADGGRICLAAEQLLQGYFADKPTTVSILRFAGIYGPDRVLRRVDSLRNAEPIAGNPDAYLNLIHADDGAASVLACETSTNAAGISVVADGQSLTRKQYFETLARLVEAPTPTFSDSAPQGNRPAKVGLNKRCRNDRLVGELGLQLTYPSIENRPARFTLMSWPRSARPTRVKYKGCFVHWDGRQSGRHTSSL